MKSKSEYHDEAGHRATLSLDQHYTIDEVAEQLRLLVLIMGFSAEQSREALPTEEDWDQFAKEIINHRD